MAPQIVEFRDPTVPGIAGATITGRAPTLITVCQPGDRIWWAGGVSLLQYFLCAAMLRLCSITQYGLSLAFIRPDCLLCSGIWRGRQEWDNLGAAPAVKGLPGDSSSSTSSCTARQVSLEAHGAVIGTRVSEGSTCAFLQPFKSLTRHPSHQIMAGMSNEELRKMFSSERVDQVLKQNEGKSLDFNSFVKQLQGNPGDKK